MPYEFSYLWQSPISFRQGESMGDTLYKVIDFLNKNQKIWSFMLEVMSFIKIIFVLPALNTPPVHCERLSLSPYSHVKQPPQSFYDMHSS